MTFFDNQPVSMGSATNIPMTPSIPSVPSKKQGWLPLLVVLFLISYGLMTMLIVEQGQTIESQRALIRELFVDSKELSAVKSQQLTHSPAAKTQGPASPASSSQTPSTQEQHPSPQAPKAKAPSSQAGPQNHAPNATATQKPQLRMPSKPASDLVDDVRTLITI
jgi:predicted lipid-binding transport protein (Tim44 family)